MSQQPVVFKGSKNGIIVVLDHQASIEEIISRIKQKFIDSSTFFSGAKLSISFAGKVLDEAEKKELTDIVKNVAGDDINIAFNITEQDNKQSFRGFYEINEGTAKFHKGTVRSGQRIAAEESIVILGDVNPGAEIVAGGNIMVMGSLRGIVHAGCFGNRYAIVAALNLYPTQLRIADIITRSPDDVIDKCQLVPEVAFVKDETIYIDAYLPRRNVDK
jgi:septum site-determining protein MinC